MVDETLFAIMSSGIVVDRLKSMILMYHAQQIGIQTKLMSMICYLMTIGPYSSVNTLLFDIMYFTE